MTIYPTKQSAIEFRQKWLNDVNRSANAPVPEEWSVEERDESVRAQRATIKRDLAALNALPDDASPDAVKRAVGM